MASKGITLPIIYKSDDTGLKNAGKSLDGFGKKLAGIAALVGAAFSVRAIGNFAKESVLAAEAAATAQNRLEAVARATGVFGAETAKVTDRLGEFAKSQEMRLAVDDKVIKGVQAQLLSFKELSGSADEVGGAFDRATVAAFDMAAAGFGSAEGNATALGKALENPIKGVAALARNGTVFTDQQKEQIKVLQESGDLLGAQELILAEVESQYGGVAEATADASVKMGLALDNIKETAGAALLPVFANLVEAMIPVTEAVGEELAKAFEDLAPVLTDIVGMLPGLISAFTPMIPIIGDLAAIFFEIIASVLPVFVQLFEDLLPIIQELVPILADAFLEVLHALLPVFLDLIKAIMPIVVALLPVMVDLIRTLAPIFVTLIQKMLPLIERVLPLFIGFVEFLTPILVWLAELLGTILIGAVNFFVTAFEKAQEFFGKFGNFFVKLWVGIQRIFVTIVNNLISGFENFLNFFVNGFNLFIKGINVIREALGDKPLTLAARVQFQRLQMPSVPQLADGGIIKATPGGVLAMIGEGGQDEAVIPLDRLGNMGGNTYNITVNAGFGTDGSQVAEQIVRLVRRYERNSGPVFARA
jgi:phage-related protein